MQGRREWLLGRWTAKHLLKHARAEYADLPLDEISVGNDPDGAPYLSVADEGRLALSLSISHRSTRAFCALLSPPPRSSGGDRTAIQTVGADMEVVEPRDPAFVRDFFTSGEAERVWRCPDEKRDTLVTVLWSAKEAVLKVLRLGLTVDTRRVELLHVEGLEAPTETTAPPPLFSPWASIVVHCSLPGTGPFYAWWRLQANDVLTLAAPAVANDPPQPQRRPWPCPSLDLTPSV